MTANNYTRGNIYRDNKSLDLVLEKHFPDKNSIIGSEAFLIAVLKEEEDQGLFLADLVYFGVCDKEIFLFAVDDFIARIPVDKLETFEFKDIEHPGYYFPPQIPPKRATLLAVSWRNSNSYVRDLIVMLPSPAIFEFELEYDSQKIYRALGELNKQSKFFTNNNSKTLAEFVSFLPKEGIPNEVNKEACAVSEFLGYN
jgi:hypothetical protein